MVTAWAHARDDPGFYWAAAQRVMADVTATDARPDALAQLIFALSALGGILLGQLADYQGEEPSAVLLAILQAHDAI
jgi:hypothetical protein